MIPKLPLALLAIASWIWIQTFTLYQSAIDIYAIRLESEPFPLTVGVTGTWSPPWDDWSEGKHPPVLAVAGIPPTARSEPPRFEILARIEPRDSFPKGESPAVDPDGWFVVGREWDWESWAGLVARRAQTIEYRVTQAAPGDAPLASLRIFGAIDEHMAEHAYFARQIAELVTFVPVLLCALWLGFAWRKRWKAARTAAHAG